MAAVISHDVVASLKQVRSSVTAACSKAKAPVEPRLVAVSKKHDHHAIQKAYDVQQRHFGENYAQEMMEKAKQLPSDIRWHFIGNLQSGKTSALIKAVPNLYMLETVDRIKLANKLNNSVQLYRLQTAEKTKAEQKDLPDWAFQPLKVMVQVNTSGEPNKSGCSPEECPDIAEYISENCNALELTGLMTIGRFDNPPTDDCFKVLLGCKTKVLERLLQKELTAPKNFELSMGMSHDMELAVANGSTNVRVGTAIFGQR